MSSKGIVVIMLFFRSLNSQTEYCTVSQTTFNNGECITDHEPIKPTVTHETLLDNVHVSIKSTEKYHNSRLPLLLLTWLQTVPSKNVYIVTDKEDNLTQSITEYGYNVYYSKCPVGHLNPMVCKCGDEFNLYYQQVEAGRNYSWYCHYDDDIYVNSIALVQLLSSLDHNDIHYLGRWSINRKIKHSVRDKRYLQLQLKRESYYFATGASYCISKQLMAEMENYIRGQKLFDTAKVIGAPDDMVIGFVVEAILGYDMTNVHQMNSHLHPLQSLKQDELVNQITVSYLLTEERTRRINPSNAIFNEHDDPTRFFSYHCLVYPTVSWCQSRTLPKL